MTVTHRGLSRLLLVINTKPLTASLGGEGFLGRKKMYKRLACAITLMSLFGASIVILVPLLFSERIDMRVSVALFIVSGGFIVSTVFAFQMRRKIGN